MLYLTFQKCMTQQIYLLHLIFQCFHFRLFLRLWLCNRTLWFWQGIRHFYLREGSIIRRTGSNEVQKHPGTLQHPPVHHLASGPLWRHVHCRRKASPHLRNEISSSHKKSSLSQPDSWSSTTVARVQEIEKEKQTDPISWQPYCHRNQQVPARGLPGVCELCALWEG